MRSKPLFTFLSSLCAAALAIAATATTRNDWWEYSSYHAWGWPCPWRITDGEYDDPFAEYPLYSRIINPALAAGFALCISRFFRPRPTQKRKPPPLGIGKVLRR